MCEMTLPCRHRIRNSNTGGLGKKHFVSFKQPRPETTPKLWREGHPYPSPPPSPPPPPADTLAQVRAWRCLDMPCVITVITINRQFYDSDGKILEIFSVKFVFF